MPGTALGIFWIDFLCKPAYKYLLHHPVLVILLICCVYGFIGYHVLKSAYLCERY
jgi:hypothetical protein